MSPNEFIVRILEGGNATVIGQRVPTVREVEALAAAEMS
jgi:hypothetical protein